MMWRPVILIGLMLTGLIRANGEVQVTCHVEVIAILCFAIKTYSLCLKYNRGI